MKYIIELEQIEGTELYKAKGCNTLVFDQNGIDKILKPLNDKPWGEICPFKKGELVEVSDCGRLWTIRYFSHIATDNEFKYRVFLDNHENGNEGWKYCRKYGTLGGIAKEQNE